MLLCYETRRRLPILKRYYNVYIFFFSYTRPSSKYYRSLKGITNSQDDPRSIKIIAAIIVNVSFNTSIDSFHCFFSVYQQLSFTHKLRNRTFVINFFIICITFIGKKGSCINYSVDFNVNWYLATFLIQNGIVLSKVETWYKLTLYNLQQYDTYWFDQSFKLGGVHCLSVMGFCHCAKVQGCSYWWSIMCNFFVTCCLLGVWRETICSSFVPSFVRLIGKLCVLL